jgi:hypothetical protein
MKHVANPEPSRRHQYRKEHDQAGRDFRSAPAHRKCLSSRKAVDVLLVNPGKNINEARRSQMTSDINRQCLLIMNVAML